jgi:uncharacterized protein YkwD
MFNRRALARMSLPLAIASLVVAAPSALADAPSTPGGDNYGFGEVKTCTTSYQAGNLGQYGAWGNYVDGCTVKVRCYFREGCAVGGHSTIQDETFGGRRVTLNSRLRILDSSGTTTQRRWDQSCDSRDFCIAGHRDAALASGSVASVQCNGVHEPSAGNARITCLIYVNRGYPAIALRGSKFRPNPCPDADTPVDQMSIQAAEAAVLCLTNRQRSAAGLPGVSYNRNLTDAAHREAAAAAANPWWDSTDPNRFDADSPHNPHRNPFDGTQPTDRIGAAGYCPAAKYRGNVRPENAYTGASYGQGATAPTPRDAVTWWMNHHIADGIPVEQNGHRAAILDPATFEMGAGVAIGTADPSVTADKGGTFLENFGTCVN